jgi:hypothetical protein
VHEQIGIGGYPSSNSIGQTIKIQGPNTDVTVEHNTCVVDIPTLDNPQYNGAGLYMKVGYGNTGIVPNPWPMHLDRQKITDNIIDGYSNAVWWDGPTGYTGQGPAGLGVFSNSIWNNNALPRQGSSNAQFAAAMPGTVTYASMGWAAIGTTVAVDMTRQPLHPSDWNVTTGTYATASTTGGPIGAILQQAPSVTTDFLMGSQHQGVSAQPGVVPASVYTGAAYTFPALQATGGTGPYTWAIDPNTPMPAGLGLNTSTGVISTSNLTAVAGGSVTFNVRATDSLGVASPFHRVQFGPVLTKPEVDAVTITNTAPLPMMTEGSAFSLQFAATGGTAPYTWSCTNPPSGTTMSTAGLLSGTPAAGSALTSIFVKANDSAGGSSWQMQLFWLGRGAGSTQIIITKHVATGTAGQSYTGSFDVEGGVGPYTWGTATTGSLPPGLTINTSNQITGTPTTAGTYQVNFSVTDANSHTNSYNNSTYLTILGTTSDWTQPVGVCMCGGVPGTPPPAYCQPLHGSTDLIDYMGLNHPPPYDGPYAPGPFCKRTSSMALTQGNNFHVGWINTFDGQNTQFMDRTWNWSPPAPQLLGFHIVGRGYEASLKFQMGTQPGQYRIWLGWFVSSPAANVPFTGSGSQYTLPIRDSNGVLTCVQCPYTVYGSAGAIPNSFADAASNTYATGAAWTAAGDGVHGGFATVIDSADTSNGQGGPMLYLDVALQGGQWHYAALSYICAQYIGPSASVKVTTLTLPDQRATIPVYQQLTASATGATWALVPGSTTVAAAPPWLTVSASGVVSGTPPAAGVYSFTVTATSGGVTSAPHTIPLSVKLAPSTAPPQSLTIGTVAAPASGEPDSYNLYRNSVLIQTGIRPLAGSITWSDPSQPTGTVYYMTAVTAGVESQGSVSVKS